MEGIDYSYGSGITAAQIKSAGKGFVCRYLSGGGSKDITKAELSNLNGAGIAVVLVFETSASRANAGNAAGKADAAKADQQAKGLGCAGIPVYFAADWDVTASQQNNVNAYLDGAASVIGKARTGLYGGYWPVKRAFDAGKITYGWQTYAWSGGNWDARAHIQQYKNDIRLGPAQVDLNRSMKPDFGQWPRPGTAAAPPPPPSGGATATVPQLHVDYFSTAHNPRCADVKVWQQKMLARGWRGIGTADGKPDGIFGPKCDAACRSFQREKGLAVDGKVGPKTWNATWTTPVT